jgi:hypothetical protein
MESFWTQHWWAVPLWLGGGALIAAVATYARRNPGARPSRVVFFFFPLLNPKPTRAPVAPWAMWLALITVFALLLMEILERWNH